MGFIADTLMVKVGIGEGEDRAGRNPRSMEPEEEGREGNRNIKFEQLRNTLPDLAQGDCRHEHMPPQALTSPRMGPHKTDTEPSRHSAALRNTSRHFAALRGTWPTK